MREQMSSSTPPPSSQPEFDPQRFTPKPPSFLLRVGWVTFVAGMMSLVFHFHYPFVPIGLFASAGLASVIALFQRRILEAATLLFFTIFFSAFFFLVISGGRSFQAECDFAKHNAPHRIPSKNRL